MRDEVEDVFMLILYVPQDIFIWNIVYLQGHNWGGGAGGERSLLHFILWLRTFL